MPANKHLWRLFLAFGLLTALLIPTTSAFGAQPNPRVLPPDSRPLGTSYADWSAKWWTWALEQPAPTNPLNDTTGQFCANNQSGQVWFLAGTGNGTMKRACTIPAGKYVYIPVANLIYVVTPELGPDSIAAGEQWLDDTWPTVTNIQAEIDGVPVRALDQYAARSPVFKVTLPEDNVFGVSLDPVPHDAMAQGIQLMIAPMPVGKHTIHVHGEFPTLGATVDVTYNLTVARAAKTAVGKN